MSDIIKMSATSIACFKKCPSLYHKRYILGLAPIEDSDALRVGTNYHRVQEIYDAEPGGVCECVHPVPEFECLTGTGPPCVLCEGTGVNPQDPMDAVVRHLNERYSVPPMSKTVEEWETEKITILYTLIGYRWWYEQQDADYTVESLEQSFDIPLLSPTTGKQLRGRLRGKIDRVFACGANRFVHDYKSTSKAIDPDSSFWSHLTLDTQTRLYTYAAAQLGLGMCGVLYDAWHKPGIKPKKLSQGDSKKFVEGEVDQETGDRIHEYCGEEFILAMHWQGNNLLKLLVNNKEAEIKPGAKEGTFQIGETPQMYGARLLEDITERPEFYFARKEVVHHSTSIEAFKHQLVSIYRTIRHMTNTNNWYENEHECEATYTCPFVEFCYNNIELGPDECPDNFTKRGR
jgi:hypothetical protein